MMLTTNERAASALVAAVSFNHCCCSSFCKPEFTSHPRAIVVFSQQHLSLCGSAYYWPHNAMSGTGMKSGSLSLFSGKRENVRETTNGSIEALQLLGLYKCNQKALYILPSLPVWSCSVLFGSSSWF